MNDPHNRPEQQAITGGSNPEVEGGAIVEVRIPTFRRPTLLRRALKSLQAQTHKHWRAVILDDSSDREGEDVVRELHEPRIHYLPNPRNLGRVGNINQAFREAPFFPDASYACVLEDDNWYDPPLLSRNIKKLTSSGCGILVRNYRLVDVAADGAQTVTNREPMRQLYGDMPRFLGLRERVEEAFFSFSIGNLSYFWRLNAGIDLSMRTETYDVHVAETGRSVCSSERFWFEPAALSNFSRFVSKELTPAGEDAPTAHHERFSHLSRILFTRRLLRLWHSETGLGIADLLRSAELRGDPSLVHRLAETGSITAARRIPHRQDRLSVLKVLPLVCLYLIPYKLRTRKRPGQPFQ